MQTLAALPNVDDLTHWRADLDRWRQQLCTELLQITAPARGADAVAPPEKSDAQHPLHRSRAARPGGVRLRPRHLSPRRVDDRRRLRDHRSGSAAQLHRPAPLARIDARDRHAARRPRRATTPRPRRSRCRPRDDDVRLAREADAKELRDAANAMRNQSDRRGERSHPGRLRRRQRADR